MSKQTIPETWSNDEIHYDRALELHRSLKLLDRHGIPGIFSGILRVDQAISIRTENCST